MLVLGSVGVSNVPGELQAGPGTQAYSVISVNVASGGGETTTLGGGDAGRVISAGARCRRC